MVPYSEESRIFTVNRPGIDIQHAHQTSSPRATFQSKRASYERASRMINGTLLV